MVHTYVFLFTPMKLKVLNSIFDVVLSRKIISFIIILKTYWLFQTFHNIGEKNLGSLLTSLGHYSLLEAAPNC